jgi:hypothetical protein
MIPLWSWVNYLPLRPIKNDSISFLPYASLSRVHRAVAPPGLHEHDPIPSSHHGTPHVPVVEKQHRHRRRHLAALSPLRPRVLNTHPSLVGLARGSIAEQRQRRCRGCTSCTSSSRCLPLSRRHAPSVVEAPPWRALRSTSSVCCGRRPRQPT